MKAGLTRMVLAAAALLLAAMPARAQQATITGTVTDSSGGVLPASRLPSSTRKRGTFSKV